VAGVDQDGGHFTNSDEAFKHHIFIPLMVFPHLLLLRLLDPNQPDIIDKDWSADSFFLRLDSSLPRGTAHLTKLQEIGFHVRYMRSGNITTDGLESYCSTLYKRYASYKWVQGYTSNNESFGLSLITFREDLPEFGIDSQPLVIIR